MPVWASIAIVVGVLLLAGAGTAFAMLGWRDYERRKLLKLLVRTEGVEAAAAALTDAVTRLASSSDTELAEFAQDAESTERRTLAEVRVRSAILADELDRMPLPRLFVPAAEAIADAAVVVGEQASLVKDTDRGADALERLGGVDLSQVRAHIHKARTLLARACDNCGLEDTAVYGGGLYL